MIVTIKEKNGNEDTYNIVTSLEDLGDMYYVVISTQGGYFHDKEDVASIEVQHDLL